MTVIGKLTVSIVVFFFSGTIFYQSIVRPFEYVLLRFYGKCTNAVIISDEYTHGIGYNRRFYYWSVFEVNGIEYRCESKATEPDEIGDTIRVIYLEKYPSINTRRAFFTEGEVPCNCE